MRTLHLFSLVTVMLSVLLVGCRTTDETRSKRNQLGIAHAVADAIIDHRSAAWRRYLPSAECMAERVAKTPRSIRKWSAEPYATSDELTWIVADRMAGKLMLLRRMMLHRVSNG